MTATRRSGGGAGERLDVGFVPAECPGANATGATHSSTLLIERLSEHHDLTVYVASQMDAADRELPARDRVEYVLRDDLPKLPHPLTNKVDALREEVDALSEHDLVHAYASAFLPVLAEVSAPTISTLNSYVPVCPKGDLLYHGTRKCSGPGAAKCVSCVAATSLRRRQGVEDELRASYTALGRLGFVRDSIDSAPDVDAFHALSPHLREDYAGLGFPEDRVRVIPHFYDEEFLSLDGYLAEGALGAGPLELLYVGGLQDIKGVDVLLRSLPVLAARGVDVRLRVAGRGPYESKLRRLADALGVDDRIDWLGYVDHAELPGEYERADAFVYPGRIDEPFGRVMLEALCAQTPVVASDVGSTDYIVGEGGVRFESDDPESLADACERLMASYDERYNAIPDHLVRFAPSVVISDFLELYADVAGAARPAGGEGAATRVRRG